MIQNRLSSPPFPQNSSLSGAIFQKLNRFSQFPSFTGIHYNEASTATQVKQVIFLKAHDITRATSSMMKPTKLSGTKEHMPTLRAFLWLSLPLDPWLFLGEKTHDFLGDQNVAAMLGTWRRRTGPACKLSMTLWNFTALPPSLVRNIPVVDGFRNPPKHPTT